MPHNEQLERDCTAQLPAESVPDEFRQLNPWLRGLWRSAGLVYGIYFFDRQHVVRRPAVFADQRNSELHKSLVGGRHFGYRANSLTLE